jgi:lipoprotein-anchoring transpeptidase ErfK/SrfK
MPATGHHVTRPFLNWWLQYGREDALGWPVTEPLRDGNRAVQYFERGALAEAPRSRDPLGIVPLNLGGAWVHRREALTDDSVEVEHDSRFFFPQTQRGVHPDLWRQYRERGGAFAFGYPLRWAQAGPARVTQIFERAVLTSNRQALTIHPIGLLEARRLGLRTAPTRPLAAIPTYDPASFAPVFGPPSDRRAEVDLTRQVATFFDGERPVYRALVSTGLYPDFTPAGNYGIFVRLDRARLVSFGDTSKTYNLPDVRYIQYFTDRWIGFHYAYWHDEFGQTLSAGCVNMRLADARWAWDFCGHGTRVVAHQ